MSEHCVTLNLTPNENVKLSIVNIATGATIETIQVKGVETIVDGHSIGGMLNVDLIPLSNDTFLISMQGPSASITMQTFQVTRVGQTDGSNYKTRLSLIQLSSIELRMGTTNTWVYKLTSSEPGKYRVLVSGDENGNSRIRIMDPITGEVETEWSPPGESFLSDSIETDKLLVYEQDEQDEGDDADEVDDDLHIFTIREYCTSREKAGEILRVETEQPCRDPNVAIQLAGMTTVGGKIDLNKFYTHRYFVDPQLLVTISSTEIQVWRRARSSLILNQTVRYGRDREFNLECIIGDRCVVREDGSNLHWFKLAADGNDSRTVEDDSSGNVATPSSITAIGKMPIVACKVFLPTESLPQLREMYMDILLADGIFNGCSDLAKLVIDYLYVSPQSEVKFL